MKSFIHFISCFLSYTVGLLCGYILGLENHYLFTIVLPLVWIIVYLIIFEVKGK